MNDTRMSASKDVRDLIRLANSQGWHVKQMGSNHLRWFPPKGRFVHTSQTPRHQIDITKMRHDLKKAGLKLDVDYPIHLKEPTSIPPPPPPPVVVQELPVVETQPPAVAEVPVVKQEPELKRNFGVGPKLLSVFEKYPERSMTLDDIHVMLRVIVPGISKPAINGHLARLVDSGAVRRLQKGLYRLGSQKPGVIHIAAPAPTATKIQLPKEEQDILDNFLNAWTQVESLLLKYRERISAFQQLQAVIGGVKLD